MFDTDLLVATITILINGTLAGVILLHRPHRRSTTLFLLTIVLILFWTLFNYFVDEVSSASLALVIMRALYAFALAFIYTFFLFAEKFEDVASPFLTRLAPFAGVLTAVSIALTLGTPYVFSQAAVGPYGLSDLTFGPLYLPSNLCCLTLVLWSTAGLLQKRHRTRSPLVIGQIELIILGWVAFLGLTIIFSAILPYYFPSLVVTSKITPLFSIFMVTTTTYSIIRHQFLDIKVIIQRGLIYSILLGCILGIYLAGILSLTYFFDAPTGGAVLASGAVTVILGIFSAPRIEAYFKKHTDQIFFKDTYEYSAALEALGAVLNANLLLPRLAVRSVRAVDAILKPEYVYFAQAKSGTRFGTSGRVARSVLLPSHVDEVRVPLFSNRSSMGEFILGPKRSGDRYTSQDHTLLRTFAIQAAVAFQKADLYEQLKEHNEHLEEKVRHRTQHLEDLRAHQRQFMDDISHALQTPLSVLKSTLEILPSASAPLQSNYMKTMNRSVDDLSRLIRNLLELASIDAVSEQTAFTLFNISELASSVIEYVQTITQEQDIRIRSHIEPGISIRGDRHQVEEAITNLLSNAVRYTAGQPARLITLIVERNPHAVRVSVTDTGIGIAPEQLPFIFERFYRAQAEQGSGLGLAITKRIVARHGGTVAATSTLGSGTCVVLEFPIP